MNTPGSENFETPRDFKFGAARLPVASKLLQRCYAVISLTKKT